MNDAEIDPVTQDSDVDDKRDAPRHKLYSVPRRFDLSTIFVVTAAYSILLGGLSALHAAPVLVAAVAVYVALVGIGQALLFRGLKPRKASILLGAVLLDGAVLVLLLREGRIDISLVVIVMAMYGVFGAILGYIAGVAIGGIFLLADVIRRRY
jgi:hypothetical protein